MPNKSRRYHLRLTDAVKLSIITSKDSHAACAERHNIARATVYTQRNRAISNPNYRAELEERLAIKPAPRNRFYRPFQDGTYAT